MKRQNNIEEFNEFYNLKEKNIKSNYNLDAIYAIDNNNGLSKNGNIPWNSKTDMSFFKLKTINNIVIMGKNTFFSLPQVNRPLKNRLNIVITNDQTLINSFHRDIIFTNNLDIYKNINKNRKKILQDYPYLKEDFKIYIIGGKQIYLHYLPYCNIIYRTQIKNNYNCDLIMNYDLSNYKETNIYENDELIINSYSLVTL